MDKYGIEITELSDEDAAKKELAEYLGAYLWHEYVTHGGQEIDGEIQMAARIAEGLDAYESVNGVEIAVFDNLINSLDDDECTEMRDGWEDCPFCDEGQCLSPKGQVKACKRDAADTDAPAEEGEGDHIVGVDVMDKEGNVFVARILYPCDTRRVTGNDGSQHEEIADDEGPWYSDEHYTFVNVYDLKEEQP
jgi:hypothetical protein